MLKKTIFNSFFKIDNLPYPCETVRSGSTVNWGKFLLTKSKYNIVGRVAGAGRSRSRNFHPASAPTPTPTLQYLKYFVSTGPKYDDDDDSDDYDSDDNDYG